MIAKYNYGMHAQNVLTMRHEVVGKLATMYCN